jgi:hypothetical protein
MTRLARGPGLALLGGLVGWAGGSCPGRAPVPAGAPCAPVEGALAAGTRAEALAGEYRLTLASTRGPAAGGSTAGTLRLRAYGARPAPVPASAGVRYPLFGAADVDLAAVGAQSAGAVDADDAARPGVLGMEWPRADAPAGTHEITLRLGADANHGDRLRFDGTFMALHVAALSADGFAGHWESGGGDQQAAGYFCAERIGTSG